MTDTIQSLVEEISKGKEKLDELMGLENTDSLEEKLESLEDASGCCGAGIMNGLCMDCKEHCK